MVTMWISKTYNSSDILVTVVDKGTNSPLVLYLNFIKKDNNIIKMPKLIKHSIARNTFINYSMYTVVVFPDNKVAKVVPIHEKGYISDITNYRPISYIHSL